MRVCGKSLKMTQVGSPNPLSGGAVVFLVVGGSTQPISKPLFPLPASSPLPPIPAPGNNIGGVILDTTSCKQQPPSPLLWGDADCIGYKKKLAQTGRLMAPLNCGVNCPQCWYSVFPPKRRSTRRFFFVSSPPPPIRFPPLFWPAAPLAETNLDGKRSPLPKWYEARESSETSSKSMDLWIKCWNQKDWISTISFYGFGNESFLISRKRSQNAFLSLEL